MAKANIYVRAPIWAAPDRVIVAGANVYAKTDTVAGNVAGVYSGNVTVAGSATARYLTQFKVGDAIVARPTNADYRQANVWNEARLIAAVDSNSKMNVVSAFTASDTGNAIQKVDYFVVNTSYGWAKAQLLKGTANTIGGANTNVQLTGAAANAIFRGDKLVFVNANVRATRTVVTVSGAQGNANIRVNANVSIAEANASAIFRIVEVMTAINNLDTRISTLA